MDSQATIRAPRGGQGLDQKELTAMPRWFKRNDNWDFGGRPDPTEAGSSEPKSRTRRLATTFVFTILFFAGASLAAVAGDRLNASVASDTPMAADDSTTSTDASSDAASAATDAAAPAADDPAAAAATEAAASHDLSAPADSATAAPDPASVAPEAAAAASDQGFSQASDSSTASPAQDASGP